MRSQTDNQVWGGVSVRVLVAVVSGMVLVWVIVVVGFFVAARRLARDAQGLEVVRRLAGVAAGA